MKMKPFVLLALLLPVVTTRADSTIEGTVELPKGKSAPVMNKRYEIVTRAGVLAP